MKKNRALAIVLALFLGGIGMHRFYIGQVGWGLVFFFFCWTLVPALFALIDVFRWAFMGEEKWQARYSKPLVQPTVTATN